MPRKKVDYSGQTKQGWTCTGRTEINGVDFITATKQKEGHTYTGNFRLTAWISGRLPEEVQEMRSNRNYLAVYLDTGEVEQFSFTSIMPPQNGIDDQRACLIYRLTRQVDGKPKLKLVHSNAKAKAVQAEATRLAIPGVTTPTPLASAISIITGQSALPQALPQGVIPNKDKPWEAESLKDAAALLENDEPLVVEKAIKTPPPARPIRDELEEGISLLTDKLLRQGKMPEHGIPQYQTPLHREVDSKLYAAEQAQELARLQAENPLSPPERLTLNHRVPPLSEEALAAFRDGLTAPEQQALDEQLAHYEMLRSLVREHNPKSPLAIAAGL